MWPLALVSIRSHPAVRWHKCALTLAEVFRGGLTCAQEKRGESHAPEPRVSPWTHVYASRGRWEGRESGREESLSNNSPSAESRTSLHAIYPRRAVPHLEQNSCIPCATTCHHRHNTVSYASSHHRLSSLKEQILKERQSLKSSSSKMGYIYTLNQLLTLRLCSVSTARLGFNC